VTVEGNTNTDDDDDDADDDADGIIGNGQVCKIDLKTLA
jgi:hypothetical protein